MWTNDHNITVGIEFSIEDAILFLFKLGYKITDLHITETDEGHFNDPYVVIYKVPVKDFTKYDKKYWKEQIESSSKPVNHPNDPIRLVFEEEMRKKLLS